jgi:hypothetical protein
LIIEVKHAEVTTNIPQGKSRDMKISEKGMAHIVGMLTNAYKDPMLAVIRENFTNGIDAHKKAGNTAPVRITLPTWDKPNYVVADNGVGMSEDDLNNNYGQYGDSTKLGSNLEAGGFGIGAKSGLAIASQFTVISVKNGRKSVAIITKQATFPKINVISNEPTDEPNGTIVTVPVKDIHDFNYKARDFFRYVDPTTVLVDGEAPSYALESATVVTSTKHPDFKAYTKNTGYGWGQRGESYVIMGNVPYSISEDDLKIAVGNDRTIFNDYVMRTTKYFIIPIGSVSLTLQREGLLYDDKTNAFIKDLMTKFTDSLKETAQAEADAAKTFLDYFRIKRTWQNQCSWKLTYRGKEWEPYLTPSKPTRRILRSVDGSSSHDTHTQISYEEHLPTFFVTGLTADEYTKINSHLTPFLRKRDLGTAVFYITDATEHLKDERTTTSDKFEVIGYEEILKESKEQRKIDRANGMTKVSKKLTYPVLVVADEKIEWLPYDEIPEGSAYALQNESREYLERIIDKIYEHPTYWNATGNVVRVAKAIASLTDFTHVTLIGRQRTEEAFLKRVPKAVNINKVLSEEVPKEFHEISTDEVRDVAAYQNSSWSKIFSTIGDDLTKEIADDTLISLASPSDKVKGAIKRAKEIYTNLTTLRGHYGLGGVKDISSIYDSDLVSNLNQQYPLLSAISGQFYKIPSDHIVAYINSVQSLHKDDVLV